MVISLFGTNKKSSSLDWIVVFLGNPGDKYENTRHNVGFMTADALGEKLNKPIQRLKFKALTNVVAIRRLPGAAHEAHHLYEPVRRGGTGGLYVL